VNELLPILSGVVLGSILGYLPPSRRVPVGAVFAVLLGLVATVWSGEFRESWGYLLLDVALVAGSAAVFILIVHRLRWKQ
jgi:hypothetical protein